MGAAAAGGDPTAAAVVTGAGAVGTTGGGTVAVGSVGGGGGGGGADTVDVTAGAPHSWQKASPSRIGWPFGHAASGAAGAPQVAQNRSSACNG